MTATAPPTYTEHMARPLRGAILQTLAATPAEAASDVVLHSILATGPHRAGLATIGAQMRWLAERGYLALEDIGGVLFATVTERGVDVAERREGDPGIRLERPRGGAGA